MAWSYVVQENYGALSTAQRQGNAVEFYNYFKNSMTLEAICGILGNIDRESELNPGQMEYGHSGSLNYGYGLIQWTPGSLLTDWASSKSYNWYDGAAQCEYINEENYYTETRPGYPNQKVWFTTSSYSYSWDAFKQINDVAVATRAYFYERERGGDSPSDVETLRVAKAQEWYTYLSGIITPFVPRLSLAYPPPSPWFTPPGNWFAANGLAPDYGITYPNGNCTWYAYGRYAEVRNNFANLPLGDAGTWYENATAFSRGDYSSGAQPQLGAIICFKDAVDPVNKPGHLTVVEQINSDGTIVVSQSGYNTIGGNTYFWTATVDRANDYRENWYTQDGRNYYCQGFIYNDNVSPPTPPTPPTPTTRRKMPLWMMLRHQI